MYRVGRYACLIGLLAAVIGGSPAVAGEHVFAGRWDGEDPSVSQSLGIVQSSDRLIIFGADGWLVAEIEPDTDGRMAQGKGSWAISQGASPIRVLVQMVSTGSNLFVVITSEDANISAEPRKLMLRRKEFEVPLRKL